VELPPEVARQLVADLQDLAERVAAATKSGRAADAPSN
jgi:hypothetical protein